MRYRSLTSKLLAVYIPLVLLSLVTLFAVQGVDFYYQQRGQLIEELQQIAEIQSKSAAIAAWEFDTDRLMATAREVAALDHIQGFRIQDEGGAILAESGSPDVPVDSREFLVTRNIVFISGDTEKLLGSLTITGNSDFIWQDLRAQVQSMFFSLLVLLLALVGATLLAIRLVIGHPIKLLHQSISRARTEGVSQKVEWQGNDELAHVVSAYNELLDAQKVAEAEIEQYQNSLEHQVEERTEELRKVVQAVEQSPLCVVITDVTGNIEHVNPTFTSMTGYESHEVLGKNSRVLKSGETPPDRYESLWETILSGKVWQSEIRNRKKNGKLYWASISIAPVTNDEGSVTHFVAMIDDITRAKKAEEELARQRMVLTSIINTIPDWIFVKEEEGRFTHINSAQAEFMDQDPEELLGTTSYEHFPRENAASFYEQDRKVLAGETCRNSEWLTYPDGSQHLMETTKVPFRDNTGKIDGILGVSRDMTERKAAEEALEKAKKAADAASQAKSEFLANMSHELRTPMNAILGYSEMLIEEAEDAEQEDFIPDLKKINQAGTHLLALINDVLDLSKIESGKMETFPEEIDLNSLIDEVAATAHPLLEKNGNQLAVERGKNLGSTFQDLTKLCQILFKMTGNG